MAQQNKDDFDVLKFFITVMALLTAIVAGFAVYLQGQVSTKTKQIKAEISTLKEMDKLALDAPFREWIGRERDTKTDSSGSSGDFKALITLQARDAAINIRDIADGGKIDNPGGTQELRFRVHIEGARVEQIVKFIVGVEQHRPGAKCREIQDLALDEKTGNTWNANIVLSIFKHNDQG